MENSKVRIIEGLEKIKEYYYSINNSLDSGEEVLVFGARSGNPGFQDAIDFFINYVHDRSQKGIKTKIIYNQDVESLGRVYENMPLVSVRYMPMGLVTKVGVNIYRDTIDMLDWSDPVNPKVIVIEDKNIAESHKEYFNLLWSATVAIRELEKKGNFYLPEILFENFISHSDEKSKVENEILNVLSEKSPRSILNVGSGFDNLSKSENFPSSVENITLVEKNTSYVQSYDNLNLNVIQTDFEQWDSEEKFDIVIVSHVFYYFKDKQKSLNKIMSLLNDGGVAIFVVHLPDGDYKKVKDLVFGFEGKKYTYTYEKLVNLVISSEFNFVEKRVDCVLQAKSNEDLYKIMRLWFEMDLNAYYKNEKEVRNIFSGSKVNYTNSVFLVSKK